MSSHIIVYLDQNYLSNMAKARIGSLKTEDDANFWHSLFDNLKEAVLADELAITRNAIEKWKAGDRYPRNAKAVLILLDRLTKRKRIPKKKRYKIIENGLKS